MNIITKKVACAIIVCNSVMPVFLAARSDNKAVIAAAQSARGRWSPVQEASNNMNMPLARPAVPPVSHASAYTIPCNSIFEKMSSFWSAIPIEMKVFGSLIALCSVSHLYYRIKRWLYASDKKENDTCLSAVAVVRAEDVGGARDTSANAERPVIGSLRAKRDSSVDLDEGGPAVPVQEDSQVVQQPTASNLRLLDCESGDNADSLGRRASDSSASSSSSGPGALADSHSDSETSDSSTLSKVSCNSCDGRKDDEQGNLRKPSTSWETPGRLPEKTVETSSLELISEVEKGVYSIACKLYGDTVSQTQIDDLTSSALQEISSMHGINSCSFEEGDDGYTIAVGKLTNIAKRCSWYKNVEETRSPLLFHEIQEKKGDKAAQSIDSLWSKVSGDISEFIESPIGPAIVRVVVPDQQGLACGSHVVVNLWAMRDLAGGKTRGTIFQKSQGKFTQLFGNRPLQFAQDSDLVRCAIKIGIPDVITAVISDRGTSQKLLDYDPMKSDKELIQALERGEESQLSKQIHDLIARKTPAVSIILNSQSVKEANNHSCHWSAVSIVYTEEMEEPVVVLMDSLKNGWSEKSKPVVQMALRQIAAKVAGAQRAQTA